MRFLDTTGLLANVDHGSLDAYVKVFAPVAWRFSRSRPGDEVEPSPEPRPGPKMV